MSKRRQQQPTSQHQSTGTQQAEGPTTEDADVVHAEQVGNGAAQEEMQGQGEEQSEAEGGLDWVIDKGKEAVGDVWDTVEDWGLEQLNSVENVLTYVDTVGIDAAMVLITQISADLVDELTEHLATHDDQRALLWTLLDWLKTASFLAQLQAEQLKTLLVEALERRAEWLMADLAALDVELLMALVQLLDGVTLDELMDLGGPLAGAVMDACWPPGIGVQLSAGGAMVIASVALGASYSGTLRHLGGGKLEGSFIVSGAAGVDVGIGGGTEGGEAGVSLRLGADGLVEGKLAAGQLGEWDGTRLIGAVCGGLALMDALDALVGSQDVPWAEMIEELSVSGECRVVGDGNLSVPDLLALGAASSLAVGAALNMKNIEGEGDRPSSADVELEFSARAFTEAEGCKVAFASKKQSGEKGDELAMEVPSFALDAELGAKVGVRLRAHLDLDAWSVSEPEVELFTATNGLGVKGEAALQIGAPDSGSLDDLLGSLEALKVSLDLPIGHELSGQMLEDSPLHILAEQVGLEVEGSIALSATLDRETTRFIAETLLGATRDEDAAMHQLQAWAQDPLGAELGDAKALLCMELAQAAHLNAKLETLIEIKLERGLEVAAGLKLGGNLSVGAQVDYEADLLKEGAAPTADDFGQIISQLGSEADVEALAAK